MAARSAARKASTSRSAACCRLAATPGGSTSAAQAGVGIAVLRQIVRGAMARSAKCLPHCRSEEHTSELQSLMRISYAVFCLKKKKKNKNKVTKSYCK